jgi:hypothetical protein
MKFNGNVVLDPFGKSEIQNLVIERVSDIPVFSGLEAGRLIYNTTLGLYFMNTGSAWMSLSTGPIETAIFDATSFELSQATTLIQTQRIYAQHVLKTML